MLPRFEDGDVIMASGWFRALRPHDIVIVHHDGKEKIKRVQHVQDGKLFLLGDNGPSSTDSRHFGWVDEAIVLGKVLWPRMGVGVETPAEPLIPSVEV
jgi:phage repressor protein C with HTH and peptisase S24 domain